MIHTSPTAQNVVIFDLKTLEVTVKLWRTKLDTDSLIYDPAFIRVASLTDWGRL